MRHVASWSFEHLTIHLKFMCIIRYLGGKCDVEYSLLFVAGFILGVGLVVIVVITALAAVGIAVGNAIAFVAGFVGGEGFAFHIDFRS